MKTRPDDAPHEEGWDESVLVWNATVARIPAPADPADGREEDAEAENGRQRPASDPSAGE